MRVSTYSHETWPELADCFLAAFDWGGGGKDS
jgi:hypothetical protein